MTFDEYGQYFFSLIQRAPGQPADDYAAVLGSSGIPAGLPPYVVPDASMPHYALTQQVGSDGRIAGRMFLPTAAPDDLGYYSHPVSPLRDGPTPGSLLWEWRDLGGPPVVTPGNGDSGSVTPPSGGLTTEDVEAIVAAMLVNYPRFGETISLQSSGDGGRSGKLLCAEGGGPEEDRQAFSLTGRSGDPGPWESWILKPGGY